MQCGKYLYSALDSLIDISEYMQLQYGDECRKVMSYKAYAKEFQTIKIAGPRRGGHTYAIARMIKDRLPGSVAIAPSVSSRQILTTEMDAIGAEGVVFSKSRLDHYHLTSHLNCPAVFVDVASTFNKSQTEDIYNSFYSIATNRHPFYFIFVE